MLTPVAAIRVQAPVALAALEGAQRAHALQATLQGCDRAARLIEHLLTLSRLEWGSTAALGTLAIGVVVRQVVASLALAQQQTIEVDAAAPCWGMADATLLSMLVRNLVDNAIRYSRRVRRCAWRGAAPPAASV